MQRTYLDLCNRFVHPILHIIRGFSPTSSHEINLSHSPKVMQREEISMCNSTVTTNVRKSVIAVDAEFEDSLS